MLWVTCESKDLLLTSYQKINGEETFRRKEELEEM